MRKISFANLDEDRTNLIAEFRERNLKHVNDLIQRNKSRDLLDTGKISDGYHTFDELYEHRACLFIQFARYIWSFYCLVHTTGSEIGEDLHVWRSMKHSDGTSIDGWFIMGINDEPGKQITYHLPLRLWEETNFADTVEQAPEWDGHTADDVLERLKTQF